MLAMKATMGLLSCNASNTENFYFYDRHLRNFEAIINIFKKIFVGLFENDNVIAVNWSRLDRQ